MPKVGVVGKKRLDVAIIYAPIVYNEIEKLTDRLPIFCRPVCLYAHSRNLVLWKLTERGWLKLKSKLLKLPNTLGRGDRLHRLLHGWEMTATAVKLDHFMPDIISMKSL